jgi:FKBP-type peptidyl-prolyl cis-trans isomerase 2
MPLVLGVTHRCWLGPFEKPLSSQASRDVDSLEHHGSRRAGLFSAAAAFIASEVGEPAGMAQDPLASTAVKGEQTLRSYAKGEGSGLFRFDRQTGYISADPNQLASRVVRVPPQPDRCQGADDGDIIGIRYAGAYELADKKGQNIETPLEASIDLLDDDEAAAATSRWAVFDTSERRQGTVPLQIPLGGSNTFLGLDLALHGMCRGERRTLYIPAALGYADRQDGRDFGVPNNANLRFDVEVTNVITWNRPQNKQGKPPEPRRVVGRLLDSEGRE